MHWAPHAIHLPCIACFLLSMSCTRAQKASSSGIYMSNSATTWLRPWL